VPAQHQRAPGAAPFQHADGIGPSRQRLSQLDVEAEAAHLRRHGARDLAFPGRAAPFAGERRIDRVDGDEFAQQAKNGIVHCGHQAMRPRPHQGHAQTGEGAAEG
jgi:hypothetical protein